MTNGRTDFNPNLSWLFYIAAIILFILAIFIDENQMDLMLAGLAAFAAGHLV
jgi:uncharacterized integral membrane protein